MGWSAHTHREGARLLENIPLLLSCESFFHTSWQVASSPPAPDLEAKRPDPEYHVGEVDPPPSVGPNLGGEFPDSMA